MHKRHSFASKDELWVFIQKALSYADEFDCFCFLNGNDYDNIPQGSFPFKLAIGAKSKIELNSDFNTFKDQLSQRDKELYGILSYDLKNRLEASLSSNNHDSTNNPDAVFFEPELTIDFTGNEVKIEANDTDSVLENIEQQELFTPEKYKDELTSKLSKVEYLDSVRKLQKHIKSGDIYEINFCIEFLVENIELDPIHSYLALNKTSASPFSSLFKWENHYLISASPERFIKKKGKKLYAQPIKGTRKRSKDLAEDQALLQELGNDLKERAENVMIVDLVRNDLTPFAKTGSIKVDELFGLYSFPQVHQMISTISAVLEDETNAIEALFRAFPMGSMTGAPKLKAMELIEKYETSRRGWYSGALGYIDANGDFDFNVVIRSIVFNSGLKTASYEAGSAITYDALPEFEYEECLLKAKALGNALYCKSSTS